MTHPRDEAVRGSGALKPLFYFRNSSLPPLRKGPVGARKKAEQAMNFAKKEGRDRVAGYAGTLFDESELRILTPAAPNGA